MSSYSYRPLTPGCIRLLRLSPHEDESAPVECRLFEYSLSPPRRGTHLYEALSYCWGCPKKSQTVATDEGSLYVTENLYAALLRLRDPGLERVIWIDAICINQDDFDEKGQQVQLMAEIYARASRVVIWLETTTGDHLIDSESQDTCQRALKVLETSAIASTIATSPLRPYYSHDLESRHNEDTQEHLAVEKLFQQPWFHRIWVLQEIAAARHVLIMCKSAEIDGQAFCLGFDQLNLFLEDRDSYIRAHSTISLMKGATIRSKCAVSGSGGFSLQILPLRRLVEVYHVREATDRRDMVYALLGMSNDTPIGLVPDYRISWKDLFCQLTRSLLSEDASVTTYNEHATAVIKAKGRVLGKIRHWVKGDRDAQEKVGVDAYAFELYDTQPDYYENSSTQRRPLDSRKPSVSWPLNLQDTTKHVQNGDLLCLLQGASHPTIVRLHKDYCSVIAISADAEECGVGPSNRWHHKTQFEFLLVWEWEPSDKRATEFSTFDSFLNDRGLGCNNLEMPDDLNIATMLLEARRFAPGFGKLLSFMAAYEDAGQSRHPNAVAATRLFDHTLRDPDIPFYEIDLAGNNTRILSYFVKEIRANANATEDLVVKAVSNKDSPEPIVFLLEACGHRINITENIVVAAARNSELINTRLLFEHEKNEITITEKILVAAAGNQTRYEEAPKVLKYILENGKGQIAITETILATAARNQSQGSAMQLLELLLEDREDQITITENILIAAANNHRFGKEVMQSLYKRKRDQIVITENVLIVAAAKKPEVLEVLLKESRDQITITENILMAAVASTPAWEANIVELLLKHKGDQITITENFLIAVVSRGYNGYSTICTLLELKGDEITVTEKIIEATQNPDTRTLLLKHSKRNEDCRRSLPTSA